MNNRSDDPLRYAPKRMRHGGQAERSDRTRWPRDPDEPARRMSDLFDDDIGRSATPAPDEGPEAEWPRMPLLVDTRPERDRRRGRSLTFGHFALAIAVAAFTAFLVVVWTRWTDGTSDRTADAEPTEPRLQAAVERRTQP